MFTQEKMPTTENRFMSYLYQFRPGFDKIDESEQVSEKDDVKASILSSAKTLWQVRHQT
jgi:hypothetical protein